MLANIKQNDNFKSKRVDKSEDEEDILIAEQRLKNPEALKNRVPFEKVLEKFNISQKEIDTAADVEFI